MSDAIVEATRDLLREVALLQIDDDEFERMLPVLIDLLKSVKLLDEIEIPLDVMPASFFIMPSDGEESE